MGISSAIGAGSKLASSAASSKSGGGGASPQQAALAQYTMGQNILKNNSAFASEGLGDSTMKTMSNAGAALGGAEQLAGISDQEAAAQQSADTSNLGSLAQSAGFGSNTGNFGNTGGNISTTPTTG